MQASEELLKEHYIALRDRPFYGRLVKYMSSGPIVAMVSAGQGPWTKERGQSARWEQQWLLAQWKQGGISPQRVS